MVKILLVEDDKNLRTSVMDSLKLIDKSYEFLEAATGEECLKILGQQRPDLILMDIMLPGIDGTETVIRLREDETYKKIPVIFLTAKTDNLTKQMGKIVGNDFIEKPFQPNDLHNRIQAALKK